MKRKLIAIAILAGSPALAWDTDNDKFSKQLFFRLAAME
jgi:hypothetical protein